LNYLPPWRHILLWPYSVLETVRRPQGLALSPMLWLKSEDNNAWIVFINMLSSLFYARALTIRPRLDLAMWFSAWKINCVFICKASETKHPSNSAVPKCVDLNEQQQFFWSAVVRSPELLVGSNPARNSWLHIWA